MERKTAVVQLVGRNADGNVISSDSINGYTDDDGVTVVIGQGYLPNLANAAKGDVTLTIVPPAVESKPAVASVLADDGYGNQVVTFS